MAELTALAWHFRAQKPSLAKLEPSLGGSPPLFLPSFFPPLFLTQPQPGGELGQESWAARAHPLQEHVGGLRSDSTPCLAKAQGLVQCKGGALEGAGRGGCRGGSRARRGLATGWPDTEPRATKRRNGVADFTGQMRKLKLREVMSPGRVAVVA